MFMRQGEGPWAKRSDNTQAEVNLSHNPFHEEGGEFQQANLLSANASYDVSNKHPLSNIYEVVRQIFRQEAPFGLVLV